MQLIQGDCLDKMPMIPDGSIDMVMADVPYGTTACKWDSVIPLEPMWKQLKREFIGIELDEKYFEIARKRITPTRPRLELKHA